MNTNTNAKVVLCYGDSNTWGRLPDRSGRYDAKTRWTGQLQKLLGYGYYVIEEGLGGRTTDLNDNDSPVRNGLDYFEPCFKSHNPDIVVIMLGTNDYKFRYERNSSDIKRAVKKYIDLINSMNNNKTKIVLMSPAVIDPVAPLFKNFYEKDYNDASGPASQRLAEEFKILADESDVASLDTTNMIQTGEDGLHLDLKSHEVLANELSTIISNL